MHFFRLKKLLAELQADPANDGRTFKYFFTSTVILSLTIILITLQSGHYGYIVICSFVATISIKSIGILGSYIVNGGKNGNYFFHRLFPIIWVLFFRLNLPLLVLFFFLAPIVLNFAGVNIAALSGSDINIITATEIFIASSIYWWRIVAHIKLLAKQTT